MLESAPTSGDIQIPATNDLISGLPRTVRDGILRHAERVDMPLGTVLCDQAKPYRDAYFPLAGYISLVAQAKDHPALEIGLIGSEGMLGATMMLGLGCAPLRAVVQESGSGWRIGATQFTRIVKDSRALRDALARYLYDFMEQLAQGTVCARFHEVEPRLARWLLMTHDRAHADHFHLTHQLLADMLGVQRSAVTIAAGRLQRQGLIRYSRGRIDVISRAGLEAASCECYDAGVDARMRRSC